MEESPSFLANRLTVEGNKVFILFEDLTPAQWNQIIYTENATWTIRSVLAHFVTAERGFLELFRNMLEGGSGVGPDFDIDRFNASQQEKTKTLSSDELLLNFKLTRKEMIAFVSGLKDGDLLLTGRHPFLGQTSLAEMIKMIYRHNQIHIRDMRKYIAETSGS